MKKFLICLMVLFASVPACFADELRLDLESKYQKKVMEIGFRILNANQIEKRMTFFYSTNKSINAVTYLRTKQILLYKGILPMLDSDDEIAAVLSHEISHGIDAHEGYIRRISNTVRPKTYEFKSDKRGVDLMVNAGYNPLAMIVMLNKLAEEPNWFEQMQSHPGGVQRLMSVYEYIYNKYPQYLINNDYKNNIYYQNFLLTTKKERNLIKQKYEFKEKQAQQKNEKSKL